MADTKKLIASRTVYNDRNERLAARIEALPDKQFNIHRTLLKGDCGTIACIAGWAVIQAKADGLIKTTDFPHDDFGSIWSSIRDTAMAYMGINHLVAEDLFIAKSGLFRPSATEAATAIRRVMNGDYPWLE